MQAFPYAAYFAQRLCLYKTHFYFTPNFAIYQREGRNFNEISQNFKIFC